MVELGETHRHSKCGPRWISALYPSYRLLLRTHPPRLAILDRETLQRRYARLRVGDVGDGAQARRQLPGVDVNTHIAALAAFEELNMRIVGQERRKRIVGRAGCRYRSSDEFGCDHGRFRIVEIDPQVVGKEGVDVAADHHGI